MKVEFLDKMGSDLTVCNAARVSFDKKAENYTEEQNKRLIQYLAKHNHFSPFCHAFLQFRVTTSIFVARQLVKHQVGLAWNEVSRRYVDDAPTFHKVTLWRRRAENKKQGSMDQSIKSSGLAHFAYWVFIKFSVLVYNFLLWLGVAPEQARIVLPHSLHTSWYWSGSLYAFARVCNLRLDSHAQAETREVAEQIYKYMLELFPYSTKALVNVSTDQAS